MLRVGLHENISILFLLAIKTAGSAQKLRVGQVSGHTAIFCLRLIYILHKLTKKLTKLVSFHRLLGTKMTSLVL